MKKIKNLAVTLTLVFMMAGSGALAQDPPMNMKDDDLGIDDHLQLEKPAEKVVTKEDVEPLIEMVYIKGGCFEMGDFVGDGDEDERPVHEVCLDDYYLADTEVTQELFELVMGYSPIKKYNRLMTVDPKAPVVYVSFSVVQDFLKKLNDLVGGYYRLPTEAEWEYAARERGKKMVWSGTNNEAEIGDYALFSDNSDKLGPVKSGKPNSLGLYGMSGNAAEWTEDYFDFDFYQASPRQNPYGPEHGIWRVARGGSYVDAPYKLRTTYRYGLEHSSRLINLGLRLAE